MPHRFLTVLVLFCCIGGALVLGRQSGISKTDRALYKQMLADIRKDLEKNYYDPKFRGIDLAAAFNDAGDKVAAAASATDHLVAPDILVWRMTAFRDSDAISPFIGKARKVASLVLDLRDNGGGTADGLKALIGWLFDHEVPVMTMIGRKGEERVIAKPRNKPFSGRLIVLVDSRSGSASEILARLVQIEKRGTVIGDRSAGAVMASAQFGHSFGIGNATFYSTSVTVSDVRMSDGASLEHVGVTPDEVLLPTPADLAAGRDPVLARAVVLMGGSMTPEQAGTLYSRK